MSRATRIESIGELSSNMGEGSSSETTVRIVPAKNTTYLESYFFSRETLTVARDLIGTTLVVGKCQGRIVEVEAYKDDAASHAVTRRHKARTMFSTFGHVYVYFIYGMYYCLNFTTEANAAGAVLIRAAEPLCGINLMSRRRGTSDPRKLASGPGKLAQAFGIDLAFNGKPIGRTVKIKPRESTPLIAASTRIGITKATDLEWRFFDKDSPFVSR